MTTPRSSYSRRAVAVTVGAAVVIFATCVYGTWGRSIDAEREAAGFFRDCMDPSAASRCEEFTEPAEHATLVRLRDEYAAACGRPSSTSARVVKTRGSVYSLSGGWFSKRHVVEGVVVSERCGTTFELEFATNAGTNLHVIAVRHDSRRLPVAAPAAVTDTARGAATAVDPARDELTAIADEPTATRPSSSEPSADDLLVGKLRGYLDCGDQARSPLAAMAAYLRALPLVTSDPAAARVRLRVVRFFDWRKCIDALAAIRDPGDAELAALGDSWSDALAALAPLLDEVERYYEQNDYLDDGWAKARLMHTRLVPAAKAFRLADDALGVATRARYRAWRERELQRLDLRSDRTVGWHERRTFLLAARVMDLGDVGILPTGVLDLDTARFGEALTDLQDQLVSLEAYVAAHPAEVASMRRGWHDVGGLLRACEGLEWPAKQMLRRKRDNRRFSPAEVERLVHGGDLPEVVNGGVPALEERYRRVVRTAKDLEIPG
jgi:hypothetical protein